MARMTKAEKAAAKAELEAAVERTPEATREEADVALGGGDVEVAGAEAPPTAELAPGFDFEMVPVANLQEHPKNANRGDVAAIGRSVLESGFYGTVTAQRSTGYVLAGNHRYRVAKERGLTEVPVTWVDVDAVGAIRILLADNETARRGTMDLGAQDALIQELKEVDPELKGTGFDTLLAGLEAEEAQAEEDERSAAESARDEDLYEEFGAKYGVIVMCHDEADQAAMYERLGDLDRDLRVVAV